MSSIGTPNPNQRTLCRSSPPSDAALDKLTWCKSSNAISRYTNISKVNHHTKCIAITHLQQASKGKHIKPSLLILCNFHLQSSYPTCIPSLFYCKTYTGINKPNMEARQSAWIRPAEERHATDMEMDSPTTNLKQLLEARAAKEAKFGSGKRPRTTLT